MTFHGSSVFLQRNIALPPLVNHWFGKIVFDHLELLSQKVITAVSNFTLKIWKSCDGQLITTLCGHKDEIYVLEPHPVSVNILLTGAHDGQVSFYLKK